MGCTEISGTKASGKSAIPVSFLSLRGVWSVNGNLKAQSKLAAAIRGHSFNLGVAAAQGNQLVDLAQGTLMRCGRAFRSIKKGNLIDAARQLGATPRRGTKDISSGLTRRDAADAWLELQYGWKPLLSDVYEAGQSVEAICNSPRIGRVTARHWEGGSFDETVVYGHIVASQKDELRYIVYLEESLSAPRSLGLMDPLSVAWEIIPYSFVVDWFVPIGTYLDALAVLPILNGQIVATWKRKQTGTCKGAGYWEGSNASGTIITLSRSVSTSLPPSKPKFIGADFWSANSNRLGNAIALVSNMFR